MCADKAAIVAKYKALMDAWAKEVSMSDVFHLILDWFQTWGPVELFPELYFDVADWLDEAHQGKETNDLVEEFLFGHQFKHLHELFAAE
jgi:hypothetical protein